MPGFPLFLLRTNYKTTWPVWQKREICGYLMGLTVNRAHVQVRGAPGADPSGAPE
jgi:hypothetical protein